MRLQRKEVQDPQTPPVPHLSGWWLSPQQRCLGILLALQEHPSSCIFYKIFQCAALWFHQTSHSRLWPHLRFLPEDRQRTKITLCGWHMFQTRGSLVRFFNMEGLKATLHVLPGAGSSLSSPFPAHSLCSCLASALMATHTGGGPQTHAELTMRKILLVRLLCKPQLCPRYCPDWPFPYTPMGLIFPYTW